MAEITIPLPPSGEIVGASALQVWSTGCSTLNLARGFGGTSDPTQIWTAMMLNYPEAFSYYFDLDEKDDDISGLLDTLKVSVLGRKRTVHPADDSPEAQRVAAFIEAQIKAIPAFHQALHALLDAPGYGLSIAEINFDVTAGQVGVLSINDTPQECFAFAEQRWMPQSGPLRFLSNPYAATGDLVPEEKFLVFSYNPRKRNRFGRPLLRRAFWPSWFKRNCLRFWLRFAEKGPGTAAVKYPSGASDDEQRKALVAAEALIEKVAIAVPSNFEMIEELLTSARSQNPAVYERLVQRNELAIARAILGETLTSHGSEQGAGSYSLGQVHREIFRQRMIELARALETVINDQLVRRLVFWNFGPDAPMPRWTINTKDPDELSVRIKLDEILQRMGLDLTENYARSMYGIPKPADADEVLQPRPLQNPQNIRRRQCCLSGRRSTAERRGICGYARKGSGADRKRPGRFRAPDGAIQTGSDRHLPHAGAGIGRCCGGRCSVRASGNCAGRRRRNGRIANIHMLVEAGIPFGAAAKVRIRAKSIEEGERFSVQLRQFVERKDQHCPYCGVSAIRCVKADLLAPVTIEPCGCVLWEGPLPETWR